MAPSSTPSRTSPTVAEMAAAISVAPNFDVSRIRGNVPEDDKRRFVSTFAYFISTREGSYGADVGQRIRMVEVNVWPGPPSRQFGRGEHNQMQGAADTENAEPRESRPEGDNAGTLKGTGYGEAIFELVVERDMCNVFGTLHGGCAAYIIDPCSSSALVVMGRALGIDGTGVSQSMNLIWHQPAHVGAKLRIVATSMFMHGRVRTARCELWDGDRLCVSSTHSTVNQRNPKSKDKNAPSRPSKL
ncbi:hypothetical protein BDN72DRAFT_840406 [Pluteus cervinus]|uniref:Uncharacterized protein n=1 Tax=Pluteus cervinus TaxID=181527 RepID=A0ACD3AVR9_9AGAR|nr:hypothetical protein BDN72DRAFT_840406 [Pluteus cervinus]